MNPAIVVVAYNRDRSLKRFLDSVLKANFDSKVDLFISIDKNENEKVYELANSFHWKHGQKEIVAQKDHLGLRKHVLACGDLVECYDSIILLEDDLFVSPHFYKFAKEALEFYQGDESIAGVSLYSQRYNETARMAFWPIDDNSDVFFLQIGSSWGECWTKDQWKGFRQWYEKDGDKDLTEADNVPLNLIKWPQSSWKKYFIKYMIDNNKFFVFPRLSLSTNFHDLGTHHAEKRTLLQVPLLLLNREWQFKRLEECTAVYDAHLEILPEKLKKLSKKLREFDFCVDFYGKKELGQVKNEFVLTSKESKHPITSYGKELKPIELNVIFEVKGSDVVLTRRDHCIADTENYDEEDVAYYYNIPREFLYHEGVKATEKLYSEYFQAIYSSRSWRLTAPLRWVTQYLRKLKREIGHRRKG